MKRKTTKKNVFAVLAVACISFVGILTETSLNVTFPTLMKQFNVTMNTIQWVTTGYLLMIAIIMLTSSYQSRRFTARQIFVFACIAFMLGSLVSAFASNFTLMILGRLISAFGAGLSIPLMFNLIVEVMPQAKWGLYMGIAGMILALAPTLGPSFGGAVTYFFGWQWIFLIVTIFALIVFFMGIFVVGKYHELTKEKMDWLGYIILICALVSLVVGFNQLGQGLSNWKFWTLLIISIIAFVGYGYYSRTSSKKILNLAVFKNKAFCCAALAYFLLQFGNIGTSFVLPNYAQIVAHQSSLIGGLILLPGSIIASLLTPWFGSMYDHFGAKTLLYTGGCLFTLGGLLFAIWGINLSMLMIIIFYGIFSLGHRMSFGNTMAEASKIQPRELQTDGTAVFQTAQQLAGSVGTTILAAILAIYQNRGNGSYAMLTAKGSQVSFGIIFGIGLLILVSYWKMFKLEKR